MNRLGGKHKEELPERPAAPCLPAQILARSVPIPRCSPFFFSSVIHAIVCLCIFLLVIGCGGEGVDPLIQKANDAWVKGANHRAVELFKAVLKKNPSGPSAEEALFRLGEIHHFSLGNSAQAILYFQEVLQLNRRGAFSPDAQKYIAEIVEFTFKDFEQAIIEYQNLINMAQSTEERSTYQYRIASIYFKMQNFDQALAEWEVLLSEYPGSKWAEESEFKVVEILYTLQRCGEARSFYDHFMETFPESKFKNEMEFVMASCLEEEGKLNEALKKFKNLEEHYIYPAILKTKMEGLEKRIKKKKSRRK